MNDSLHVMHTDADNYLALRPPQGNVHMHVRVHAETYRHVNVD